MGEIDGLARTEVDLDATGASVTHLRCGYFFTNLQLGLQGDVLPLTMPVDLRLSWVDPRDVGDVAAARLLSTDWSGRHVLAVKGPEDLTFTEAVAIVSEVTGRSLRAEQIPDDAMRDALRCRRSGRADDRGHPRDVDRDALGLHPRAGAHAADDDAHDAPRLGGREPALAGDHARERRVIVAQPR